jgi:outer membrane protein TolC
MESSREPRRALLHRVAAIVFVFSRSSSWTSTTENFPWSVWSARRAYFYVLQFRGSESIALGIHSQWPGVLMPKISAAVRIALAAFAVHSLFSSPVQAEPFRAQTQRLLSEHHLMRMVAADMQTAQQTIKAEKSSWYPRASVQVNGGNQDIDRDQGASGEFNPAQQTVSINQLITDFGVTSSRVRSAEAVFVKERQEAVLQRQNLLLAAVEAQLGLLRANEQLKYARESEANIKRQTQLESGRMEAGRGYATDVLQAKAQLAGAEARRVVAARDLQEAVNRYEAVFGVAPGSMDDLEGLMPPLALLPQSELELVEIVRKQGNPDVMAALSRTAVARADRDVQRNREFMPRLDLQLARRYYEELDGVPGERTDTEIMLRLTWSFDMGGRAHFVSNAARSSVVSASEKAEYVRVQALEESRNAWTSWQSARERAAFLGNQVAITGNFLELARKERDLGRRSLLDLLSGETALINAKSDAMAARVDEVLATYRVLRAAGGMDLAIFDMPGIVVPGSQLTQVIGPAATVAAVK